MNELAVGVLQLLKTSSSSLQSDLMNFLGTGLRDLANDIIASKEDLLRSFQVPVTVLYGFGSAYCFFTGRKFIVAVKLH